MNPFCALSFKLCINDKYMSCHWIGYSKMKPINIGELFKRKDPTMKWNQLYM